jgi:hypothetical protein
MAASDARRFLDWVQGWVVGYSDDPALRPVLVALGGHLVVVAAPLLLVGWRTGSVLAWVSTALLLVASGWLTRVEWAHRGRPGAIGASLWASWLGAVVFAWFCERTGFL